MQSDPTCYIVSTKIGDRYYLTHMWNSRPHISKDKRIAQVFESLYEAEIAKVKCEAWSGFAYQIEIIS